MAEACLSRSARLALLDDALACAPHDVGKADTWLFAYGAMLEAPPFLPVSDEVVTCDGWRRDFCLSDPLIRGTAERPGTLLGASGGGRCTGVAWRLLAQSAYDDLTEVFKQELRLPFYKAGWARVSSRRGEALALIFRADEDSPLFEPNLGRDDVLHRLSTCQGEAGANLDYLEEVVGSLDRRGVPDLKLTRLLRETRKYKAAHP